MVHSLEMQVPFLNPQIQLQILALELPYFVSVPV